MSNLGGMKMQAYLISHSDKFRQAWVPVEILGPFGVERHYYRLRLPDGKITIANDSLIKFEEVE